MLERRTNQTGFTGGCLCGDVRYRSNSPPLATIHCYCTDCRRIGGTGHATHTVIPDGDFLLEGVVAEYERQADSGNRINRRFCPRCGSAIFHTRDGLPGKLVVRTSSMDDPEIAKPERIIYASSAVSWDHFDANLPAEQRMTGQSE